METLNDCFVAALQKNLKDQGRGAKKKLAASVGVSPNHLSDILGLRKNAGHKLKERIAEDLGVSFEDLLVLGRRLLEGQDDAPGDLGSDFKSSSLAGLGRGASTNDFLAMASDILKSDTLYREALIGNILAYHGAMELVQKEARALQLVGSLRAEIDAMRKDIDELQQSEKNIENPPEADAV